MHFIKSALDGIDWTELDRFHRIIHTLFHTSIRPHNPSSLLQSAAPSQTMSAWPVSHIRLADLQLQR